MKKGFTLIELLIVIAIIAILALIAIPNFLEAQTRAKVSRVYADMRTIATAIEAYTVDYNREPLGPRELEDVFGVPASQKVRISWSTMTTPVAYLTTLPRDPFTEKTRSKIESGGTTDAWLKGGLFAYEALGAIGRRFYAPEYEFSVYEGAYENGYTWYLRTLGPSRMRPAKTGDTESRILRDKRIIHIYDPTNGTMSIGYIIRTNRGQYPDW